MNRAGIFYYVRRIPADLKQHYSVKRLCFSLRTKSHSQAMRTASSVHQRLEDYWLVLRLQQMDIPAIHLVQVGTTHDTSPPIMEAVELYLSINGKEGTTFKRTARRNAEYVANDTSDNALIRKLVNANAQIPFSLGREGGQNLRKGKPYMVSKGEIDQS